MKKYISILFVLFVFIFTGCSKVHQCDFQSSVSNDVCEFYVDEYEFVQTVEPLNPTMFSFYLDDIEDETYVIFRGTMKNVSSNIIFPATFEIRIYLGDYVYNGFIYYDDGSVLSLHQIDPLDECDIVILASIPDLALNEEPVSMFIGMNKDTSYYHKGNLNSMDYCYKFS